MGEMIFERVDYQTLTKCKEADRKTCEFLNNGRFLWVQMIRKNITPVRLEEKLFFSFLFCVRAKKKSDFFILEKPFFMQANPVFIMQTLCVCAGSKQILFFYN